MTPFQHSYLITTRRSPCYSYCANITPLPEGELWFYTAPGQYQADACAYEPVGPASSTAPADFVSALTSDLRIAIANGCPQLTLLIHGLGNLFTDAVHELSVVGAGLRQYASYGGLVVSFDWPSFDSLDSDLHYSSLPYSFPPTQTSGTVRGNINGSAAAFVNLLGLLQPIQQSLLPTVLQLNVVCHSEGNFMLMAALPRVRGLKPVFNQTLLVAADINNGALQASGPPPHTGQGLPISALSNRVTIYYSAHDDVLPKSQDLLFLFHNPSYYHRLGLQGPHSFAAGALPANTCGIDCSNVVSESVITKIPQVPHGTSSHSSYFYIPQVLSDWAETLNDAAGKAVSNRVPNPAAADGQGYVMQLVSPPQATLVRNASVGT